MELYPLSSRQMDPDGLARAPRHVAGLALRIKGELRIDALKGALDDVVERQEALRTRLNYDETDGTLGYQEVLPPLPVPLAVHDIPVPPGQSRDEIAVELLTALNDEPLSFLITPSLHATLHRFDEHDAVLTLLSHHLFSDGWSVGILRREIAACYRARVTGIPHTLPSPIPYRDFATWEQEFLQGERAAAARRFWQQNLAGARMCTMPTDRPHSPETALPRSAVRNFSIDPDTLAKVTASAARHRCSVWHVFLAAFMALEEKITGQSDITLLTVNSGRPSREFYNTIGFFANLVPVRLEFDDCATFLDLMLLARKASANAQQHQIPFGAILEMFPDLMNGSGDPLALPAGFNYISSPADHEDNEFTTSVEPVTPPEEQPASFRRGAFIWTFLVVPGGEFRCVVEYEPDAVDASTVDRWGTEFIETILAIADRPDQVWNR
ncbi:MAG TPA: condensation domain-containing protein [Pseudonocardiaceae bacterium]|nr:condensation domain-containing protein [Pseudonocardiaceae bacterium]